MTTPLHFSRRSAFLEAVLYAVLAVTSTVCSGADIASSPKSLDLDSAHVLAARAAGFGFALKEMSFPARCVGEDKTRGNVIALTVESDRTVAWADVGCEHVLFDNKSLQNGWTVAKAAVKRRCEQWEGGAWKPLPENHCELDARTPAVGGTRLETRVRGSLKGSGPILAQARRMEVTYQFTLTGPAEMSPWTARR